MGGIRVQRWTGVPLIAALLAAMVVALAWGAGQASAAPGGCFFDDGTHIAVADTANDDAETVCTNQGGEFLDDDDYQDFLDIEADVAAAQPAEGSATFPDDWYKSLGPCVDLSSTNGDENKIRTVYILRTIELAAQIAYDIGSNEVSGVTGAVLGTFLGIVRIPVFVEEWIYDVQDECQEIVERNTIQDINTLVIDKLDVKVSTRASQVSLNAFERRNLLLYVEDHLGKCAPIASIMLPNSVGGFRQEALAHMVDLANRSEANGHNVRTTRVLIRKSRRYFNAGKEKKGFALLCVAYRKVT